MEVKIEFEATGDRAKWEQDLASLGVSNPDVFSRKNLTGAEPIIIAILKVAAASMQVLAALLRNRRITKIRVGEVEIQNPTPEQIDQLLKG